MVVADTSSLLMTGTSLINVLEDCTLVIPSIVVKELEEKRTASTVGYLSREWIRLLENLRTDFGSGLAQGVPLVESNNVVIRVEPNHVNQQSLPVHLQDGSNDSTVLAVAMNLLKEHPDVTGYDADDAVVLLSNDTPMRLHATLDLKISAFEYSATLVAGVEPFDGRYDISVPDEDYAAALSSSAGISEIILEALPEDRSYNAFVSVSLDSGEHIADVLVSGDEIVDVEHKNKAFGIVGRTTEQDAVIQLLRESSEEIPVVSIGGSAGTGKTLLTVAVALDELSRHNYQRVVIFRSLHELGKGQEMGFLPGGVEDKIGPWAGAVFDAIDTISARRKPSKKNEATASLDGGGGTNRQKEESERLRSMVEISPITYLRGRSLSNTFMVIEEAQNFSRSEILNILSRAGQGTKVVLTFDAAQVDNKFLQSGRNADIWSVIDSLKNKDLFAHITLRRTERSRVAEVAAHLLED